MTVAGWVAGTSVVSFISAYDHWIAFVLLLVVGGKMVLKGIQGKEEMAQRTDMLQVLPLAALSLATSIDSLAVGLSFDMLQMPVLFLALHHRDCLLCNLICRCHARRTTRGYPG